MTTDYEKMQKAFSKLLYGFLISIFNIQIGYINVLPSFLSYFFFSQAIELLWEEERELKLIHSMSSFLFYYEFISWLTGISAEFFAGTFTTLYGFDSVSDIDTVLLKPLGLIVNIVCIYFKFQLLTDISAVAQKHLPESPHPKRLAVCRTFQTVSFTALVIGDLIQPLFSADFKYVLIGIAAINIISSLSCIVVIYLLGDALPKTNEELKKPAP